MDDYVVSNLNESKNEWAMRLVNILAPLIIEGLRAIFSEADRLCIDNNEEEKYLMTFQNLLANIPNWSANTVELETERITDKSGCSYLPDLISCVHVIQLKILTCVRVGRDSKSVAIDIPSFSAFIHKVYINVARQLYSNIYLFEKEIQPLSVQKNNRELEIITRDCILNTVRENIPVENILKAYLAETDESVETELPEVDEEKEAEPAKATQSDSGVSTQTSPVSEPSVQAPTPSAPAPSAPAPSALATSAPATSAPATAPSPFASAHFASAQSEEEPKGLSFSDTDMAISTNQVIEPIHAPKTIDRLEEISQSRQQDDDGDDEDRIEILGDPVKLDVLDVNDLREPSQPKGPALSGVEIL